MSMKSATKNGCSVKAYQGDAKTLLAFNLPDRDSARNLAGFTIKVCPPGREPNYVQNSLQFKVPGNHAQDATQPATSTFNAPIHKFRWIHIPGAFFQGTSPAMGKYTYVVTPRFFDDAQSLQPLDPSRSVSVTIDVVPFQMDGLQLGFTRGFTQSQAFVHHFGLKAKINPPGHELQFDTTAVAGTNNDNKTFTYEEAYAWLGFTARQRIFEILNEVLQNKNLSLDVFAYDLNEPDVIGLLLKLAKQGRARVILDNATLHHDKDLTKPEDKFEQAFTETCKAPAEIKRGKYQRFAHDKVMIVSEISDKKQPVPLKVLTGSTNFSVTGLYVNSNHVLVFNNPDVAEKYEEVFQESWDDGVSVKFNKSPLSSEIYESPSKQSPKAQKVRKMEITFSPHTTDVAQSILDNIVTRIQDEKKSVLFAVMEVGVGTGPVYPALKKLHADQEIFSYGISDTTDGIALYSPGSKDGVLVTGRPTKTKLPPPFDQVPSVGIGHQVHHKFIVCGFNGDDPVVYCGSSNLALGGEQSNGDNLIAIHDADVATVFAIEAVGLVDHFEFLDRSSQSAGNTVAKPKFASKQQVAASAGWFLSTTDKWVEPYFDKNDLRQMDRVLFG